MIVEPYIYIYSMCMCRICNHIQIHIWAAIKHAFLELHMHICVYTYMHVCLYVYMCVYIVFFVMYFRHMYIYIYNLNVYNVYSYTEFVYPWAAILSLISGIIYVHMCVCIVCSVMYFEAHMLYICGI